MASLDINMAPSTHCSASMSCGGVRSGVRGASSRYGVITSARLTCHSPLGFGPETPDSGIVDRGGLGPDPASPTLSCTADISTRARPPGPTPEQRTLVPHPGEASCPQGLWTRWPDLWGTRHLPVQGLGTTWGQAPISV